MSGRIAAVVAITITNVYMKFNKENAPVGTKCLIKEATYRASIEEVTIVEWSESGKYVKLKYPSGSETWNQYIVNDGEIVEILPQKSELKDNNYSGIVACLTCGKTIYPCSHILVEFPQLITPKEL